MSIAENINKIKGELPEDVTLVAVTKYHDLAQTQAVVDAGVNDLGESRVQDLQQKWDAIQGEVRWHFIGHLQRNKVKYLIGRVYLIQSVDSLRLLETIEKESAKQDVVTDILVQFNVAGEESKSGFGVMEYEAVFSRRADYPHVNIRGIMAMGPNTTNSGEIKKIFAQTRRLYDIINETYYNHTHSMDILSMGMSRDYPLAVEEKANLVRIGSKIFE